MTQKTTPEVVASSDGLGAGSEARGPYIASNMRMAGSGRRFTVLDGGRVIDDDDFIFDATITIGGDFTPVQRLAFAQWVAEALNEADKKLPREPRGA